MMNSLRTRLLTGMAGGMLLLLLLFSLLLYGTIQSALLTQFDNSLRATAHMLAASVEQDANEIELGVNLQLLPEFQNAHYPVYYQLWRSDETTLAKSPLLHDENLPRLGNSLDSSVPTELHGPDGRVQRAVSLRFLPRPADEDKSGPQPRATLQALSLTVARDATGLYHQLQSLRWLLFLLSAAVMALSFLVAAVVVRRGLSPLRLMAGRIASIRSADLTARIDVEPLPTELVPIRERLNDLLARIEASFQREQRFTGDVAHELRTPLAGIRSTLEVTLMRVRSTGEYQCTLSDCLEIVQQMQAMVNNLLTLARLDTRQMPLRREQVSLVELVTSCWRAFGDRAIQRRITFECDIPDDLTCVSDPDNLSMILSNLLDNATEYANEGGRIKMAAHRTDGSVKLTISNTGCSLTDAQISQVFDCFWRGDSSRRDVGVHCGLGLALVQRLAEALGGSVVAERQPGGLFAVRLTLPRHGQTEEETRSSEKDPDQNAPV